MNEAVMNEMAVLDEEQEAQAVAPAEQKKEYLTFLVDDQLYGVSVADVVQIIGVGDITEIPELPSYVKGILNLRGSIITVVDVRLRMGKCERAYDERTCIIETMIQDKLVGFIVDRVDSVTDIEDESILKPPTLADRETDTYLTGIAKVGERIVLLLNLSLLFFG